MKTSPLKAKALTILVAVVAAICLASGTFTAPTFFGRRLDENNDEEEGLQTTIVLLFMFFGLAVGIMAMQLLSFFGEAIPYTCAVFLIGVFFSLGNIHSDGNYSFF